VTSCHRKNPRIGEPNSTSLIDINYQAIKKRVLQRM